jgi:hypothetical protein
LQKAHSTRRREGRGQAKKKKKKKRKRETSTHGSHRAWRKRYDAEKKAQPVLRSSAGEGEIAVFRSLCENATI